MIEVRCVYYNAKTKGDDYFIFTDVEVKGHSENNGYTMNNRICAGISACCFGIKDLINKAQYELEIRSGYFHCTTFKTKDAYNKDKQSAYALNTLVCQLYSIYKQYPSSFKCFDLIDEKEN